MQESGVSWEQQPWAEQASVCVRPAQPNNPKIENAKNSIFFILLFEYRPPHHYCQPF
jgi:hypothetical protein